ncbi:response regulator [Pleionea sp. CnH1-48]|uniref:response regulator n=1 Tax=Pleionea sp. CnH1-48 TaxID=2954494 RepID=UPI002098578E|nr:response regulator [Pleionea sp. CnH1-48]MCO7223469.1 response regulator [Pleionea sp. CnH1-48]
MNAKTDYSVLMVGLSKDEINIIDKVFKLSTVGKKYQLSFAARHAAEDASIAIVNGDDLQLVKRWKIWNARSRPIFTIYACRQQRVNNTCVTIAKPFTPINIIRGIEAALYHGFNIIPDTTIDDETQLSSSNQITPHSTKSTRRALVVDDCPTILTAMRMHLDLMGIQAVCCDSGEEALNLCRTNHFDLIFLDVVLDGIDGYEVCRNIKQIAHLKSAPVCMLTGKSNMFNIVRGKLAGCDKYLTKPAKSHELSQAVMELLKVDSIARLKTA